jgi:hypothetical protein
VRFTPEKEKNSFQTGIEWFGKRKLILLDDDGREEKLLFPIHVINNLINVYT